jgi:hypothetical protein
MVLSPDSENGRTANERFGATAGEVRIWKVVRKSRRCAKPSSRCRQADERGGQSCGNRENLNVDYNFKYNFLFFVEK